MNCADVAIDGDGNGGNRDTTTTTTTTPSTNAPTTKQPTTMQPSTQAPTTKQPTTIQPSTQAPTTMQPTKEHNPTCGVDEVLDCIGVGVYDGLGYESWCNAHCKAKAPACTPDLCKCHCRQPNCYAIGEFAAVPGMDQYCAENCIGGCDDKSDICRCD